jgi:hypothetical protein
MRKFGLVISLAAAAIAGTACNNTGFDGSWAYQQFNGVYESSNNAAGASTLPELDVAVTTDFTGWWSGESLSKYNGCTPQISVQLYKFIASGATPTWGRYFDTGELSAHPFGDVYSYVRDDSGDVFISGPSYAQILAGDCGYTTGVAFGPLCGNGTGGVNGNGLWVDTIVCRQITPLNGYFSTGLTDNLSFFMLPGYSNDAVNHDVSANSGIGDRLSLGTRIEILKSIDLDNDIVRTTLSSGVVREDIKARITSMTIDGETFVPTMETSFTIRDFAAISLNLGDPSFKAISGWIADRLQAAVDAGRRPNFSMTINNSLSLSSQEIASMLPEMRVHLGGQALVDKLRSFSGSTDQTSTRRVRFDRRFTEDTSADFGLR